MPYLKNPAGRIVCIDDPIEFEKFEKTQGFTKISKEEENEYITKKYEEENGPQKCAFRLPQREEWIWAARGGLQLAPYPWGGPYLRNAKGCYLCNFRTLNERHITYNYEKQQYELVTEAAESFSEDGAFQTIITGHYAPNDYGLYDMSGNVWQFVNDWYERDYYAHSPADNPPGPASGSITPEHRPRQLNSSSCISNRLSSEKPLKSSRYRNRVKV